MTQDEQKALLIVAGGVELLRLAIAKGDPQRELEFRARDIAVDLRGVIDGNAKTIASFAPART